MKRAIFIIFFITLILTNHIFAQIAANGKPISFQLNLVDQNFETISLAQPDLKQILLEDSLSEDKFLPRRFCIMIPVKITQSNAGTLTKLDDGRLIWRLKIRAEGALALSLYFDVFRLENDAQLFLYDDTGNQLKGGYTSFNNHKSGFFATELIYGDAVTLEMHHSALSDISNFRISDIGYAYRDVTQYNFSKGFGGSDFCEVNIGCNPEGLNWQEEKNGVVRIQVRVSGSGYWCTGSLVNNVRNDNTPFILTADHCAFQLGHYATPSDLNQWLFYFRYESTSCENPVQEPPLKSMVGATKIAQGGNRGNTGSDFYLIRLNQTIPADYNPYFIGWSAENTGSSSGVTIHHPDGDIKKISSFTTPIETVSWLGNGLQSHWKVFWAETENGWGVTEGGSSGSPLFNNAGKIIGTLTGGYAACEPSGNLGPDKPDYYGKFSYHWLSNGESDTAQLKPWLDPDNTGLTQLEGKILSVNKPKSAYENINIFPNPTKGIVNINFINFEPSEIKLVLTDNLGRQAKYYFFQSGCKNALLNISDLKDGVYSVNIEFNQRSIVKKIIKLSHLND